jgi:hypothetical protein
MPTLILPPRYTDDSIALWRAATGTAGWSTMRLSGWRLDPGFPADHPVPYGEPLFVLTVADQLGLAPLEPPLDFLALLPWRFRRRHVRFAAGSDIPTLEFPAFLKPADDKCFPAAVYRSAAELARFAIPDAVPILWSEPVSWEVEFRCFIAGRRNLTLCPYARHGELSQAEDGSWVSSDDERSAAAEFLRDLLASSEIDLPPALVIDVGLIEGRGWAIVEFQSLLGCRHLWLRSAAGAGRAARKHRPGGGAPTRGQALDRAASGFIA